MLALESLGKNYAHLVGISKNRLKATSTTGPSVLVAGAYGSDGLLSFCNIIIFPQFEITKSRYVLRSLNENRPVTKLDASWGHCLGLELI